MKDRDFLEWCAARFVNVHDESPYVDFVTKLLNIAEETPEVQDTPNQPISEAEYIRAGIMRRHTWEIIEDEFGPVAVICSKCPVKFEATRALR